MDDRGSIEGLRCEWCGRLMLPDEQWVSAPDGPVHVGECAKRLLEAIQQEYLERRDYMEVHEE